MCRRVCVNGFYENSCVPLGVSGHVALSGIDRCTTVSLTFLVKFHTYCCLVLLCSVHMCFRAPYPANEASLPVLTVLHTMAVGYP